MNQYHEPYEELSKETRDLTRAFRSLIEEFEAVDWYNQRMDVVEDAQLKEILKHNRDEEVEHAAMTLEWLRRKLPIIDKELRDNLFKEGDIAGHHGHDEEGEESSESGSLKIK